MVSCVKKKLAKLGDAIAISKKVLKSGNEKNPYKTAQAQRANFTEKNQKCVNKIQIINIKDV